ncbi:MAG: HAMP domain-containing sensor histidine kinase [Gloeobacterales cyanobacterium]
MFSAIEKRLLWNNLAVLGGILLIFTVSVYVLFSQSIASQLDERLVLLARAVSLSVESEDGKIQFNESVYLGSGQERVVLGEDATAQWLTPGGQVLRTQGHLPLDNKPLQLNRLLTQEHPTRARIYSESVHDPEDGKLLGYVRVALALATQENTLGRLQWGLAGGVTLAMTLATLGSVWLTRQAMRPAEAGYQRLQQFTADASHELRSPLTAIKLNTATALRHPEQLSMTEIQNSFTQIQDAADQMTHLTQDLLLLARADELSGLEINGEPLSLDELLAELVTEMQVLAQEKQIDLSYQTEAAPMVLGNINQLKRLFQNLIENAVYYTPPSGRVIVMLQEREHEALVSVTDTGIGIAPEHCEQVFDRFWRADKARSRHSGGNGLGLAIAQRIAGSHGGNISVHSKENEGSSFIVKLPLWKLGAGPRQLKKWSL